MGLNLSERVGELVDDYENCGPTGKQGTTDEGEDVM